MNGEIRKAAKAARVPFWRIADVLGISEATFARLMRKELPANKRAEILAIIEKEASHG